MSRQATEKRSFTEHFKAKFGRYYKIIKPLSRVLLGTTLEGKDTAFIVRSIKKKPKNFFKAKVHSLPELTHKIETSSPTDLKKDELRELLETLPLLLRNIAITGERWYMGKIKDHPFDIFIAPERLVKIKGKDVNIYRGLYIQTKQLYQYPPKRMTLCKWASFFQSIIEKKITSIDFGFNGHIHFHNRILFNEPVSIEELKSTLKRIYIPYNRYIDTMSVSFVLINPKNDVTTMTIGFYPRLYSINAFDLDFEKAKKIYLREDWEKISFRW